MAFEPYALVAVDSDYERFFRLLGWGKKPEDPNRITYAKLHFTLTSERLEMFEYDFEIYRGFNFCDIIRSQMGALGPYDWRFTQEEQDAFSKNDTDTNAPRQLRKITELGDGALYEGEWFISTNQRDGRGICQKASGSRYDGFWKDDQADGYGRLINVNGDVYDGIWKRDKANGLGSYTKLDGYKYVGRWKNNQENGKGVEHWPDGSSYSGMYLNGMKDGEGQLTQEDGSFYDGEFKNNNFHGYGVYKQSNGREYKGDWALDQMNGEGCLIWEDKSQYVGGFLNDVRHGQGIMVWPDGRKFEGEFVSGRRFNGIEYFELQDGEPVIECRWEDGTRVVARPEEIKVE